MNNINDTVENITAKINDNEYVGKIKNNKNYKYIKMGSIILAAILVICLLGSIFGDKYEKKAITEVKSDLTTTLGYENCKVTKVKSKVVDKNKDKHLYVLDTSYEYKDSDGEKNKCTEFYIVYSYKDDVSVQSSYPYDTDSKQSKQEMKDFSLNEIK